MAATPRIETRKIILSRVNKENSERVIGLSVCDDQKDFVETSAVAHLRALYQGWKTRIFQFETEEYSPANILGCATFTYYPDKKSVKIFHFMIDIFHQNRGYGKTCIKLLISYIKRRYKDAEEIYLLVDRKNKRAIKLYKQQGFKISGGPINGQLVIVPDDLYRLSLRTHNIKKK